MHSFDPQDYSPRVAELLAVARLPDLGPGSPDQRQHQRLERLTAASLLAPRTVGDADMAAACVAGLWLYCDFLEQSHTISQGIETPSGSYWHGIMHRREGDYDNANYWFRRVGMHPAYEALCSDARELALANQAAQGPSDPAADFLTSQAHWDAARFVDLCRHATSRGSKCEPLCRQVQLREWQLLFDYCYRYAASPGGSP